MSVLILNETEVLQMLIKRTGKWGMRISLSGDTYDDCMKAAPYLHPIKHATGELIEIVRSVLDQG